MKESDERNFLYNLLDSYTSFDSVEEEKRLEIMKFVEENEKCFEIDYKPGHITGSALVTNVSFDSVLLTHHSRLNMWFQLGGHSYGDPNTLNAGLRKAYEESGLTDIDFIQGLVGIFDVDVHPIPKDTYLETKHFHYDIRQLLMADPESVSLANSESHDIKWIKLEDVPKYSNEEAFLRMIQKVKAIKGGL